MGSPVDLTLGRCSNESPSSNKGFHNDNGLSLKKEPVQEYLRSLKEERRKVEGFKRELPVCIQLLDDAIRSAEEKLTVHVLPENENDIIMSPEVSRRPTLEEFMPLKRRERDDQRSDTSSDGEPDYCGTKKRTQPAWMAEARFWNQTTKAVRDEVTRDPEQSEQERSSVTSSQQRPTGGGAFVPFQQNVAMPVVSRPRPRSGGFCADLNLSCVQDPERPAVTTLPLRAAVSEVEVRSTEATAAAAHMVPGNSVAIPGTTSDPAGNIHNISSGGDRGGGISGSSTRKARRCWSPELHRRFVSALQQLGGPHIATPKQLRELMKVDGLTNDEVKSHLQKYRLHTVRRPSSSSPHESGQQLVVVGGIWMPPQQTAAASPPGSHSGVSDPSQFCHSKDYFAACINNGTPAAAGPAPMQMLQLHRQPIFDSPQPGTSQSQTSPQGPLQVTSQLSGATQGSSSDTYESGEEEARSQSKSLNKLCSQSRTVEVSQLRQ